MPTKIIHDCDPGHDDAIATLLAWGNPDIDLVAITTVAGNQTLAKVTANALAVMEIGGIAGIPIAAGCHRPLVRTPIIAADIHGESGMDGPVLPATTIAVDPRHGVDLMIDVIMSNAPREITVVATAALTNVAMAARKEPRIVERVREVVIMGGAYGPGNYSATAEFNIAADPEAAQIVFTESWNVTMVGLDVTHQALATPDVLNRLRSLNNKQATFVVELLEFFGRQYKAQQGFDSPPVHDPCAVAYVIDPTVLKVRPAPIDVELSGTLTTGTTVVDLRSTPQPGCTTHVATALDADKFWDLVIDALDRLGQPTNVNTPASG